MEMDKFNVHKSGDFKICLMSGKFFTAYILELRLLLENYLKIYLHWPSG